MGLLLARLFTTRTKPFTFWFMLETDTTKIQIIIHSIFGGNNQVILPEMKPSNFAFGIIATDH